jgi:tight adherence protein B
MSASYHLIVQALVFVAVLTFVFGSFVALRSRAAYRGSIQNRLHSPEKESIDTRDELIRIRRSRSLNSEGDYLFPLYRLNKLLLQSGASFGVPGLVVIALGGGAAAFFASSIAGVNTVISALAGVLIGLTLPIFVLRGMRDRRQSKFEAQLPDAIEVLVRSLRAGHSLAGAVAAVGKHMPDPIGAEFRLTAAEVTYGLDLETAMANLHSRFPCKQERVAISPKC